MQAEYQGLNDEGKDTVASLRNAKVECKDVVIRVWVVESRWRCEGIHGITKEYKHLHTYRFLLGCLIALTTISTIN